MKKSAALLCAVLALLPLGTPSRGHAETIYALAAPSLPGATISEILTFNTTATGTITNTAVISGLTGGDTIVDLDVRPANGLLYGIAGSGNLYTINPVTGIATFNATPNGATLTGTPTSTDFNPVADRLRVIATNSAASIGGTNPGQLNYRLTPGTGALTVDGTLAYAAGDVNAGRADRPNIIGSAYSNNFAGAATTTLYGLDNVVGNFGTQGFLVMHSGTPAFNTLNTVAGLTLNGSAFDLPDNTGFDISGGSGIAYVSISNTNPLGQVGDFLFSLDLATGVLTPVGSTGLIGSGTSIYNIQSIAVAVPEPSSVALGIVGALALGAAAARHRHRQQQNA